jgi:hypothetical protein
MRRTMLFVTITLVAAATIAAGALPTFAKQAKTKGKEQGVGAAACLVPGRYETVQAAVNNAGCQTIQLVGNSIEAVTIDRNVTITGSNEEPPPIVGGSTGKPVFAILPGNTVTFEDFHIDGGGGASVEKGGCIYNQGTLVLDGMVVRTNTATDGGGIYNAGTTTINGGIVFSNTATDKGGGIYNAGTLTLGKGLSVNSNVANADGGGVYNQGTLYQCGATVTENEAPPGTENDISGAPAQQCPTSPEQGGPPKGENRVLLDHKGKELCLPKAALKGHLEHGDEVLNEEGCPDPVRKNRHQSVDGRGR